MLKTLLLKSLPGGGILNRVSYSAGSWNEGADKAEAVAWITTQRDRWLANAPHYCGGRLVTVEG